MKNAVTILMTIVLVFGVANLARSQTTRPASAKNDSDAIVKAADELSKKKDYKGAMAQFRKAAELGNARAQDRIGDLYRERAGCGEGP